jgi:chromate transporter
VRGSTARLAALAVFAPPYLIVIGGAPYYRRFAQNLQVRAFVQGVTAAAVGAIAGAAYILGRRSLIDLPTVVIAVLTLGLLSAKKIPEPILILAAGAVGLLIFHGPS